MRKRQACPPRPDIASKQQDHKLNRTAREVRGWLSSLKCVEIFAGDVLRTGKDAARYLITCVLPQHVGRELPASILQSTGDKEPVL